MIKKFLKTWIFPPGVINLLEQLKPKKQSPKKEVFLPENAVLKDKGQGKRAFLIATGPSIKSENLDLLAEEDCFSLSNFYLHKSIDKINPMFHFFAPYHEPLILENYIEWLHDADKKLPKSTSIFLGLADKHLVTEYNLFPNRNVRFLKLGSSKYINIDITTTCPSPATSPLMVLNVLLYMGYDEIYLLGCDHNTLLDYGKTRSNFYSQSQEKRKNATDANSWSPIDKELVFHINVFKAYREIIENNDVNLVNLSQESWLNFIEKRRLADVLESN